MKSSPRKRRTREHILADLSVNHVERHVLRCGYVVERMQHDYGIDLEMLTFTRAGEVEEGKVLLQLKATARLSLDDQSTIRWRLDRRDVVHWLAQPMPVILVVYDAAADKAYWLYVQDHFRRWKGFNIFAAGKTLTVQIPLGNVLNTAAIRRFREYRRRILEQIRELSHEGDN